MSPTARTMVLGTGRAALDFPDGLGLFGFGPGGGRGSSAPTADVTHDTLYAKALYLERGDQRLLLISLDLAAGSRTIQDGVVEGLAKDGHRFRKGEVLVIGTHTHSGPGEYFDSIYDIFGGPPTFQAARTTAEIIAKSLVAARAALAERTPCRVGFATRTLWRAGRNRSLRPFLANFEGDPTRWPVEAGLTPPDEMTPEEIAVDPRLRVIAFVDPEGRPLATWGSWCCHPATIHRASMRPYHRDWPGIAVDRMERGGVPFAMMHQAANGDVTGLPSGERRVPHAGARMNELADAVTTAWEDGWAEAAKNATDAELEVGFRWFVPAREPLPKFEIGQPCISGSEEYDPGLLVKMFGEAATLPWRGQSPQRPKFPAMGPIFALTRVVKALQARAEHPMWLLRLGDHVFFASPFEQTTYAAWTVEKTLVQAWRAARSETITASPLGLAGDYAGYLTTPEEYELQNYEGGHTIYGRDQLKTLVRLWSGMIGSAPLDARSDG